MHAFFQRQSIRGKVILVIMITSGISLILAFTAFSINDLYVMSKKQRTKLNIIARIIAVNSQAAVSFNDSTAAIETLLSLKAEEHIRSAGIYDIKGRALARYEDMSLPNLTPDIIFEHKQYYKDGFFHVYQPISLDKKTIGLVYLKADTGEMYELIKNYLIYGAAIILACLGVAFGMAAALQRSISGPVNSLTQLAESVSVQKKYSLRAKKSSEDELGKLVDRFNEMLAEIEKRDAALVRSNRDLEQFAYIASHDLQEPLRMVINYVELLALQAQETKDPRTQQYMGFILEGAMRSQQLIKDLLEFSRAGIDSTNVQDMRAEEVLARAIKFLSYTIEENAAMITWDPLPTVHVDPVKLAQVFQNLIGNAIKFRRKDTPAIHISAKADSGFWIFSVKDNGIGIDPEYFDRIFVIFKRLHTRDTYAGTGIGLAICKRVIEQHGGNIWVESKPDVGSAFYFTLPAIRTAV